MSAAAKVVLGLIVALVLAVAVQSWRVHHKDVALRTATVAPAQARADIASAKVETVIVQLAAARDTVTRVLTRVRVDTFMLRPATHEDTATGAAQLPGAVAQLDSVTRSCKAYVVSCDEFRAGAQQKFHADSALIGSLYATLRDRPMPRRFSLGLTLGYGATAFRDSTHAVKVVTGPSATLGGTWRIW